MPYERMHHTQLHQTTTGNGMMDSLSLQLRDAETRRAEIERAHQVSKPRGVCRSSGNKFNKLVLD